MIPPHPASQADQIAQTRRYPLTRVLPHQLLHEGAHLVAPHIRISPQVANRPTIGQYD
jgi:hypothetical protein